MKRVEIDIEDVVKHYLPRVSEEQADQGVRNRSEQNPVDAIPAGAFDG
jgi:hypothetical protein